jgi:hypothetical protein
MNLYQYCRNNPVNFIDPWGLWGRGGLGNIPGHRDLGNGWIMGFDYSKEDDNWKTCPWPWGQPDNHFRSRPDVERELLDAVKNGDRDRFEHLMHQGQDTFSHYEKGFRWPWTLGHVFDGTAPDYPFNEDGLGTNKAFKDADRWTRHWEDRWNKAREQESSNCPK